MSIAFSDAPLGAVGDQKRLRRMQGEQERRFPFPPTECTAAATVSRNVLLQKVVETSRAAQASWSKGHRARQEERSATLLGQTRGIGSP